MAEPPGNSDVRNSEPARRGWLQVIGPGFITGISDADPTSIGTYAQAGAMFGFATLWTLLVTYPMMAGVQYICARIGLASGRGLASNLRKHYSRWIVFPAVLALIIANTINVGADIQAIAAGFGLFVPGVRLLYLIVPIGLVLLAMQIWASYALIERTFKWLTLALFAYLAALFFVRLDWLQVLRATVMPSWKPGSQYLAMMVAILGTVISPYIFFWQTDQEVEEERQSGSLHRGVPGQIGHTKQVRTVLDVNVGMFTCNLVMYAITLTTAATLYRSGHRDIQSALEAAQALKPLAGIGASWLFGLGLIGTGLLAVPVMTSSIGYAVSETFGWRYGLDRRPGQAPRFYEVIAAATVAGMLLDFLKINPIKALFWTSVVNGFIAPPLLVLIMLIANRQDVMGDDVNGPLANLIGWVATAAMFAAAAGLVLTWGK